MANKIDLFNETQLRKDLPQIKSGDTVRVFQKIKEGEKQRIQSFEGVILARKHGKGISSTITVRKTVAGVGVERVFPLHSPNLDRIELVRQGKVRRSKIYYLRGAKGKRARLKNQENAKTAPEKKSLPETE